MASNNFESLQKRWPQLYEHASFAESYVYTDPHTAIIKLRCFAEQLVGVLYRELNLACEYNDGFFEKLKASVFIDVIDEAILEKLHAIRMFGNKAAHGGRRVESKDALALVREAYLIGQWLFKTYSGTIVDEYPAYVEAPQSAESLQTLHEANTQLEDQLLAAKSELERLEASEKAAQHSACELKISLDEARLEDFKQASTQAAASFDLDIENTRQLISVHDAFAEYKLTDGQTELVDHLDKFLSSKDDNVFLLKGYAGTGKTFITKGLTEYFRAIGRNYVLAAPTGKASKVIAKKTKSAAYTIHKTIYSFKDIVEYREENLDGSETYKFYAQLAVNNMSADTVFIVDEASMVADVYQEDEFFRFGSGYLLRDFFKFVNLDHNDHRKKVIFIGDDAQLPPVGMNFSPALDANYLLREHNTTSVGYGLTDVVRQKAGSGVMVNSIKLRESLRKGVFNQLAVDVNYPDIEKVEYQDLMGRYLESCNGKINAESIILAHSNPDVAAYNHQIREHFFPGIIEVARGDKVMAVSNSNAYGFFISNGDFGQVKEVLGKPESRRVTLRSKNSDTNVVDETVITLAFRDVRIAFKDLEDVPHVFQAKIFEDLLYSDYSGLSSDESKALYLDFCIRHPDLKRGSLEFKDTLRSDPFFNALRLKFGYAITCHKAQGSEWNNVFVKCKTYHSQLSADYFRWFYTAITRTANKLYLLDPPSIKLGSSIKMVASPTAIAYGGGSTVENDVSVQSSTNKPVLTQNPSHVSANDEQSTFGIPSNAHFSLEILKRVLELLSSSGINVKEVHQNQYQESYFFQKGSEMTRVDIAYNGKGKISRLTSPDVSELSGEVHDLLSSLKGVLVVPIVANSDTNFEFSEDFLKEFHQRLVFLAEQIGILINNVESMDWKQRYTFVRSSESAVFDVFYNGKKQLTKCAEVRNAGSSEGLKNEILSLLTEGMNA